MKTPMPYALAITVAAALVNRFTPHVARIAVAGSVLRQKEEIGDIEIVAIPLPSLYAELDALLKATHIRHTEPKRWGQKLRAFCFDLNSGKTVQADLFLQPDPATWGVNMMIRTGSSDFSRKMVTQRSKGGFMPNQYRIKDARVWFNGVALETSEERDVFHLWGMEYVEPAQRTDFYKPKFHEVPAVDVVQPVAQAALF